jgi:hypothetical protein
VPRSHLATFRDVLARMGIPIDAVEDHEDGTDLTIGHGDGEPGLTAKFEFDEAGKFLGFGLWREHGAVEFPEEEDDE